MTNERKHLIRELTPEIQAAINKYLATTRGAQYFGSRARAIKQETHLSIRIEHITGAEDIQIRIT